MYNTKDAHKVQKEIPRARQEKARRKGATTDPLCSTRKAWYFM